MCKKTWTNIRVTEETAALLKQVKASLQIGYERGQRTLKLGPDGENTNDNAIEILAQQFIAHKRRGGRTTPATEPQPRHIPTGRTHQRELLFHD